MPEDAIRGVQGPKGPQGEPLRPEIFRGLRNWWLHRFCPPPPVKLPPAKQEPTDAR
jgi:hypothetical protein